MQNGTFQVNEKSLGFFLEQHLGITERKSSCYDSLTNFLKDELIVKKSETLTNNKVVQFECLDCLAHSGRRVITTYVYSVRDYDDVSFNLILVDYKIKLKTDQPQVLQS